MINRDEKFDKISLKFILIGFIFSQKITLIGQIYILEIFSILYLILNIRTIKFNPLLKKRRSRSSHQYFTQNHSQITRFNVTQHYFTEIFWEGDH